MQRIVVRAPFGLTGLQRHERLGSIDRLNLGYLVAKRPAYDRSTAIDFIANHPLHLVLRQRSGLQLS